MATPVEQIRVITDPKTEENINKNVIKCTEWLSNCSVSDDCDSLSCSDLTTDGISDNFSDSEVVLHSEDVCMSDKIISKDGENLISWNDLTNNPNQYKNIQVYKSQNVHIGNITHIHGSVYINQFAPTLNQKIIINNNVDKAFPIVSRITWLAQPPLDPDDVHYFSHPVKYVIINHSATEEAYTQTDNNLLVRLIQQFHIESRKWNDISYNFLVGADGSVFEGRGWKVVGAHTLGYNSISIGISFIGCYMKKLPPAIAMKRLHELIKYGVEIGAIAEDYKILAHCQCRSSENPGRKLFEEMKSWERWDGSIDMNNSPPLNSQ